MSAPCWEKVAAVLAMLDALGGTPPPAYLYDLDALRDHAARLRAGLPARVEFYYAIKANSEYPLLDVLADQVDGFEISSGGELDWVRARFPHVPLIMSGPGKLDEELRAAIAKNVTVHVESRWELERLTTLAAAAGRCVKIFLRINLPLGDLANTTLVMGGRPTPFGIGVDELAPLLDAIAGQGALKLEGFHFHLLSHQGDAGAHLALLRRYLDTVRDWQKRFGIAVRCINVGGGIGVNYKETTRQFDWALFSAGLREWLDAEPDRPLLRFELGRYVSAFCGFYAAPVLDIKTSYDTHYAVVRGGTMQFRTPAAQGHSHPLRIIAGARTADANVPTLTQSAVTVVGQLCTPKDVMARGVPMDELRVGDWIVFSHAGAYAWHISHQNFLRHPHPRQIFLAGDTVAGLHPPNLS